MWITEILELKECIEDLCEAEKIPIDLRFYHLADVNGFFIMAKCLKLNVTNIMQKMPMI